MNEIKNVIDSLYSKFVLRDFLGFWIPGVVLLVGIRGLIEPSIFPDIHAKLPNNPKLYFACVVGLAYGAGVALQMVPNVLDRLWLMIWDKKLKDFYEMEKKFLEGVSRTPMRAEIRERVAILKLMASKLGVALAFVLWPVRTYLACLTLLCAIAFHFELFCRQYDYTDVS